METINQMSTQPVLVREIDLVAPEIIDHSSYSPLKIKVDSYRSDSLDESEMREIAQQFKMLAMDEPALSLPGMKKFKTNSPRQSKNLEKMGEDDSSSYSAKKFESKQNYSDISCSDSDGEQEK